MEQYKGGGLINYIQVLKKSQYIMMKKFNEFGTLLLLIKWLEEK